MRRVVVEMQVLVADVRHPIQVAEDAVGEPCPQAPSSTGRITTSEK